MLKEQLIQFGLTSPQAEVYGILLEHGAKKAGEIAKLTTIKRGLVYKALDDLEKLDLVERRGEEGSITKFFPRHPEILRTHIEAKLRQAKEAEILFTGLAPTLGSAFNLITGKPGIRVLEGLQGFKDLHRDIIAEGKPIKLIRSLYDRERADIATFIDKQIREQVRHEISAKILTHNTPKAAKFALWGDDDRLVHRRIIADKNFQSPAQVIIYGNKVGITDLEKTLITTIIENEAIRKTFETMFDYMWQAAKVGHEKLLAEVEKEQ